MDECAAHRNHIAELERRLVARDKTVAALMRRLADHTASNGSAFAVLEQNIALEKVVARKTREVERERHELENALTELRTTQARLLQAQKLESMGQLAAGVAHEINTPTQYVSDNVTFLKRCFESLLTVLESALVVVSAAREKGVAAELVASADAAVRKARLDYLREHVPAALEQSQEGLNRVATIVSALKEFSHPSVGEKEPVDLAEMIRTTVTVARNEWKYVSELETHFDPRMPAVDCLRNELSQVILNLVVNAAHAISDRVKHDARARGRIRISTHLDGECAEIRVEDSGMGIPENIRSRVFDPFFTTKAVGQGTGQGLAIAYATVVDKHDGQIHFETEAGRGTTFIVRLPLAAETETVVEP